MATLKEFLYEKNRHDISKRIVWILNAPSDKYFGLDLTQFPMNEREYYISELERIDDMLKQEIENLGLKSCYRFFLADKICSKD